MSARNNARHVRQRKLNTKQGLRVIREGEIEDGAEDETQRNIPQVETGVEKGEEVEFHLQAVITAANAAALGTSTQQSFIPTPETVKAKDVDYDALYPKVFSQPATYIRFSSTVEESIGVAYCMNEQDVLFLNKLNESKEFDGRDRKDKAAQCSMDMFESVMDLFEQTVARSQTFTTVENAPTPSLDEIVESNEEHLTDELRKWLQPIYVYWAAQKMGRPRMPTIKVRVLDTVSEADDADPYICFRRREVRQTRKTRGRDAQVVDKLKKLRLELEQARKMVQLVVQREQLNKENLEVSRKVFEERRKLKEVKVSKNIIGEKGDDEDLLVNQKAVSKPKRQTEAAPMRPSAIRIRSIGERTATDNDLDLLSDRLAEAESFVSNNIETRKEQHKKWNNHWIDRTWMPLTPPPEDIGEPPKWGTLSYEENGYPTPPPSIPSVSRETSQTKEVDVEMRDRDDPQGFDTKSRVKEESRVDKPFQSQDLRFRIFHIPGAWPTDPGDHVNYRQRDASPACRLRYGRGGRCFLETRKRKAPGHLARGVISDSESDDEPDVPEFFPVSERLTFDYRCALNSRSRPDPASAERKSSTGNDASAAAVPRPTTSSGTSVTG